MSDSIVELPRREPTRAFLKSSGIGIAVATACLVSAALQAQPATSMTLTSTAFAPGGAIPGKYTCEGQGVSPPLAWHGVPKGARSLVLIEEDPDAPDPAAPKTTWAHWLLYDIPPETLGLAEGARSLPVGSREGSNDWKRPGYGGPCPPIGRHRYIHTLFALDVVLGDRHAPDRQALLTALRGHVIAQARLVGTYQKAAH